MSQAQEFAREYNAYRRDGEAQNDIFDSKRHERREPDYVDECGLLVLTFADRSIAVVDETYTAQPIDQRAPSTDTDDEEE